MYVLHWDSLKEYEIREGNLHESWALRLPVEAKRLTSWGFSPNTRFFYLVYERGGFLVIYRVNLGEGVVDAVFLAGPWRGEGKVDMAITNEGSIAVFIEEEPRLFIFGERAETINLEERVEKLLVADNRFVVVGSTRIAVVTPGTVSGKANVLVVKPTDDLGRAVEGAVLYLNGTRLELMNSSKVIGLVRPGVYEVRVELEGHEPYTSMVKVNGYTILKPLLYGLARLNVTVAYSDGLTPASCKIELSDQASGATLASMDTCSMSIEVRRGCYVLKIQAGDQNVTRRFQLLNDSTINIMLRRIHALSLTIRGEEGEIIENARVSLLYPNGSRVLETICGECRFKIQEGRYVLRVEAGGYNPEIREINVDKDADVTIILKKEATSALTYQAVTYILLAVTITATIILLVVKHVIPGRRRR